MTQLYNNPALAIGPTAITIPIAVGKWQGKTQGNITILNNQPGTGPVTVLYLSQKQVRPEIVQPNVPYFARNIQLDSIQISCTVSTIIAIDVSSETELPANFVATQSKGGTNYGLAFTALGVTQTTVYTVPSGFKAEILRVFTAIASGSPKFYLGIGNSTLWPPPTWSPEPFDYLFFEYAIPSALTCILSQNPADHVVINPPYIMMPGDSLYAYCSGTDTFDLWVELLIELL